MNEKQQGNRLLPAYLVVGADALKRQTVLDRLRKRLDADGNLAFNHDTFDGARAEGKDIIGACNTLPFASEYRLVEVSQVDKLPKAASDAVAEYLAHPSETTVLALMCEKLAKNTRLYKAVSALDAKAVIDCEPLKRYELAHAVRNLATGYGITITQSAAETLIELVGEDTIRLDSELKKLSLAHSGIDAVNTNEVLALVSRTAEVKPWEFVNAFSARNVAQCMRYYPLIDASAISLLSQCVARIRELICARSLSERGESARLAETLRQPGWRVKNHTVWASRFGNGALERAIVTARDCERAMKSGSDQDYVFMRWVITTLSDV